MLIRHSKYRPYCQNYTPTDCFFGDFAHWVRFESSVVFKV